MYCSVNLESLKHETYLNNTYEGGNVSIAKRSGTSAIFLSLGFKSSRLALLLIRMKFDNFKQNTEKMNSECVFSYFHNEHTKAEITQRINNGDS
jgi:hypothetical protein